MATTNKSFGTKFNEITSPETTITSLKTFIHGIYCFLLFYTFLLVLLLPVILVLLCWRIIIFVIFWVFYNGTYKLVPVSEGFFGIDRFANVFNIEFFLYIDGKADIDLLRQRIFEKFTTFVDSKDRRRPYEIMLSSFETKFGFFCWKNTRSTTFDINHHMRYHPDCCDPSKIYTESEIFASAGKLLDQPWDETKPRWEFLVIPQLRKSDTGEVCSGIHLRVQHAWSDGVSLAQIVRLCVADKTESKFLVDPVDPPGFRLTFWLKLKAVLMVFLVGPWVLLRYAGRKEEHVFSEGPLKGGKYLGRTTMEISVGMMREMRRFYGCSTTGLHHFVFTEAMRKMALKREFPLPANVLGGIVLSQIPFPNEYPQNRAVQLAEEMPIGNISYWERLAKIDELCGKASVFRNYHAILTVRCFFRLVGVMPAVVIRNVFESLKVVYVISNVPGLKGTVYFGGKRVLNVFGFGPLVNGNRYFAGIGIYEEKFTFGVTCEQSNLIKSQADMDELVAGIENEINFLMENVTV